MFIFFLHSFMQMLPSNLYMPYAPEDCHNYFKNHELHSVLEGVFLKSYLNQRKILRKIPLKVQVNTIRRFHLHFFFHLRPIVMCYSFINPRIIYYMPFIYLALFQGLKVFFFKWWQSNTYPSETIPKNCRGGNISKLILWSHHHPDIKTWQRYHKKGKLQANFTDEHRCKNSQQNTSKLSPTIH